ncbi:MAG TPA: MarR family transcriptional regulator [Alloacidobacterium sp.]|nr:MarR family transcriptional regulator [Alloacidobacterium sp.]
MRKTTSTQDIRALAQQMESQLQSIRQMMRRQLDAEYSKGDLTAPQQLVMRAVCKAEGLSLKELSRSVCLAHSTVSGIVDRLEKRGFVIRRTSKEDNRVTQIIASPAVRDFLQKRAPALTLHPLTRALKRATQAQRAAVETGLSTLEELLRKGS